MERNVMSKIVVLIATLCAALGGCCPTPSLRPIIAPPPISLDEQISRLAQWSRSLPRIQAKAGDGGVTIKSRDAEGHNHSVSAGGTLLIRQPGDILLVGTA